MNIFGVNISVLSKKDILRKIEKFLNDGGQHYIVTPNPEILLTAQRDEELFYILNQADLAVPDGFGLKLAAWAMGKNITRVTGADLTENILRMAEINDYKVAIFNWRAGLSDSGKIKKALVHKFPKLKCRVEDVDREWMMPFYQNINTFEPDIVFVTLGSPWQEKFVYGALPKMPYIKLAIGVGGAFDFLTGALKRAPAPMRAIGLEWLWRLIKQPRRIRRIYNAVIIFSLKFAKWRLINPFLYRSNVVCLLFKKENGGIRILIVERNKEPGHWQLPQGGTENADIMTAGIKELTEELGTCNFKPVRVFNNVYRYKFSSKEIVTRNGAVKRHKAYKGQKQSLLIAEFTGYDTDIKLNYWDHQGWKWADRDKLIDSVHPVRKEGTRLFLKKFDETVTLSD